MNLNQIPVLSIETATPVCSVALRMPDGTMIEERTEGKGVHSEQAFVFIRKLLDEAGIKAGDLGAVLISGGPGSYTGLRIGGSAVKGLLFQSDVSLYACNTLAGFALGVVRARMIDKADSKYIFGRDTEYPSEGNLKIDAVIDARRNHLYHQSWHYGNNGLTPGSRLKTIELETALAWWMSGRLLAGTGSERIMQLARNRGSDLSGLTPITGTSIISAATILDYVTGDHGQDCVTGESEDESDEGHDMKLIRKVNPSEFVPDYYSGL